MSSESNTYDDLNIELNKWQNIQDFNWIGNTPSKNYTLDYN